MHQVPLPPTETQYQKAQLAHIPSRLSQRQLILSFHSCNLSKHLCLLSIRQHMTRPILSIKIWISRKRNDIFKSS